MYVERYVYNKEEHINIYIYRYIYILEKGTFVFMENSTYMLKTYIGIGIYIWVYWRIVYVKDT